MTRSSVGPFLVAEPILEAEDANPRATSSHGLGSLLPSSSCGAFLRESAARGSESQSGNLDSPSFHPQSVPPVTSPCCPGRPLCIWHCYVCVTLTTAAPGRPIVRISAQPSPAPWAVTLPSSLPPSIWVAREQVSPDSSCLSSRFDHATSPRDVRNLLFQFDP